MAQVLSRSFGQCAPPRPRNKEDCRNVTDGPHRKTSPSGLLCSRDCLVRKRSPAGTCQQRGGKAGSARKRVAYRGMSQHRPLKTGDHVYLIDGSGYIFRAYHALPPLTRKSDGLPVGAVTGFCNMLWKLMKEMKAGEKPTHLAVIFDKSEQTFRKRIYADYKAHRPDPPADLIPQFGLI